VWRACLADYAALRAAWGGDRHATTKQGGTTMEDMTEQMMRKLAAHKASRAEGSRALWRMSPAQRVAAMKNGELSVDQLYEWAKRAPREVPLINGEFAFIAAATPEVADRKPNRGR
jgi:hypothetical protein